MARFRRPSLSALRFRFFPPVPLTSADVNTTVYWPLNTTRRFGVCLTFADAKSRSFTAARTRVPYRPVNITIGIGNRSYAVQSAQKNHNKIYPVDDKCTYWNRADVLDAIVIKRSEHVRTEVLRRWTWTMCETETFWWNDALVFKYEPSKARIKFERKWCVRFTAWTTADRQNNCLCVIQIRVYDTRVRPSLYNGFVCTPFFFVSRRRRAIIRYVVYEIEKKKHSAQPNPYFDNLFCFIYGETVIYIVRVID